MNKELLELTENRNGNIYAVVNVYDEPILLTASYDPIETKTIFNKILRKYKHKPTDAAFDCYKTMIYSCSVCNGQNQDCNCKQILGAE